MTQLLCSGLPLAGYHTQLLGMKQSERQPLVGMKAAGHTVRFHAQTMEAPVCEAASLCACW